MVLTDARRDAQSPTFSPPRVVRVRPWAPLRALRERLDVLLPAIAVGGEAAAAALEALAAVGAALQRLCALDPDALLAAPLLLREGRYGTCHALSSAIVLEQTLARLHTDADARRSAVLAALTMNVGMITLHETLWAQPGPLTDGQRADLLVHPLRGAALLHDAGVTDTLWLQIVAQHHEHLDGSGFPGKVTGAALRPEAGALMIAERWCAMVAPRGYRPGAPPDRALEVLMPRLLAQADRTSLAAFVETVGPYPPGTSVRLADGEIGLVHRRTSAPGSPNVLAFRAPQGEPYAEGVHRPGAEPRWRIAGCVPPAELGDAVDPLRIWEAVERLEPAAG